MECESLPVDLEREILLRLPVRSVLRCKCVCKSWCSLISDPQFAINHYDLAAAPCHRLLFRENEFYARSVDLESPLTMYYRDTVYFPLPLTSPPCVDEYHYRSIYQPVILASCRGFVILFYKDSNDLILWNPTIGTHKRIKFDTDITYQYLYGFGYDALTDDYLLVFIALYDYEYVQTEINIFSFKTETWSKDYSNVSYSHLDQGEGRDRFRAGSLFNGTLNWVVFSKDRLRSVIVAYDLIQRSFSEIPLSSHFSSMNCRVYGLRVIEGCLGVCCWEHQHDTAEMWLMKEYKVHSSWFKRFVVPTHEFTPICVAKDGGIFGSNTSGRGGLEKFTTIGHLLADYEFGGDRAMFCTNLQCAMYRESLLSIPSVIKKTREDDHWETSEDDHWYTSEHDYDDDQQ